MREQLAADAPVKLRRVARPAVIVGALVLVAVMVAAAFVAGWNVRPPEQLDEQKRELVEVTAVVEERVVQEGIQVPGKVAEPEIVKLNLTGAGPLGTPAQADASEAASEALGAAGGESSQGTGSQTVKGDGEAASAATRNVVTVARSSVGDVLAYGSVLAEVSGRPVIGVPHTTPLFRDFAVGISGEDVRAVQQLLSDLGYWVDVDGVLDADAMEAFRYWYAQLGYELLPGPGKTSVLPWSELLTLPAGQLTVTAAAGVGVALDEDHPLLAVRRGNPLVELIVDEVTAETFRADSSVYLLADGQSYPSEVLAIGDIETNKDTGAVGRKMTVVCPPELAERVSAGSAVTVASARPKDPAAAVPLIALNEDGKGQFVRVPGEATGSSEDEAAPSLRVDVEVLAVSGGWAAIAENPQLPAGTKIRVG